MLAHRLRVARWASLSAGRLALYALLFNLPFVLARMHRAAFDPYTHIFLADHYRQQWWDLWEPRWYLGFSVVSYPPLVHQAIALLSWPVEALLRFFAPAPEAFPGAFRWTAEEIGFLLVLLGVLTLFPIAVRAFARIFVGPRAAGLAGLLSIGLPALSLTAWAFGQLPTVAATVAVLAALARGHAFVLRGERLALAQAVALAAVAGAAHHGVFLFVPLAGAAVAAQALLSLPAPARRAALLRLAAWAALSALAVAAVLWPFLAWSRGQPLQTPIDHPSRHNLLTDARAAAFFFWPMYGPLLLVWPWLLPGLARRPARWRRWPLALLGLALAVLGLGGTTPLPRWLFGTGWAWLTYDRFSFWAGVCALPLAGGAAAWLARRGLAGRRALLALAVVMVVWAGVAGSLSLLARSQPAPVDMAPLARFLSQPEQQPYRYLTLGFGDQLAKLAAITRNGTPDGLYHTARGLRELQVSGLGAVDGAVWNPHGAQAAAPFLARAGEYGVRWAFVHHSDYVPVLAQAGWQFRFRVGNVEAWEWPGAQPRPGLAAPPEARGWPAWWWGGVPLLALVTAAALLAWPMPRPTRAGLILGLRRARGLLLALTGAATCLWWVHVFYNRELPWVYFTYQSALLFASDALAAGCLAVWALERWLRGERPRWGPALPGLGVAGLALAAALSVPASVDPVLSLAAAAHWLLLAGWYWMLINDPPSVAGLSAAAGALVVAQSALALAQALTQSTGWLRGLHTHWPGALNAEVLGASVVVNAAGERWLRAYGTLPHPNILGGLLLAGLGLMVERYLSTGRVRWLAASALGAVALALTFSRAAWLGAGLMLAAAWLLRPGARRGVAVGRGLRAAAVTGTAAVAVLLPLLPFMLARVHASGPAAELEQRSVNQRLSLAAAGVELALAQPLTGLGAGGFVVALAARALPNIPLEPAHNVPLLAAAETGLPGVLALAALAAGALHRWRRRRAVAQWPEQALAVVLLGLAAVALLDHFWWTLPPARLAWVTLFGVWVGWGEAASRSGSPARAGSAPPAR